MFNEILGEKIQQFLIYDIKAIDKTTVENKLKEKVEIVKSWQDAYLKSNIFITCTVSESRYIDQKPKKGSLLLNISLRDYKKDIYDYVKNNIIVDNWEEVCREDTDIEMLVKECDLAEKDTKSIIDVVQNGIQLDRTDRDCVMFNPMGMGIFDIAIAKHYFDLAKAKNIGKQLL